MTPPRKLHSFKLPDATIGQLDAIARLMPRSASGMPATRTDALIEAVERLSRDAVASVIAEAALAQQGK